MKPAHTIVEVPLHVLRVPTCLRKQFAGHDPKVRIGATYQPAIHIAPAIEIYPPRRSPIWRGIRLALQVSLIFAIFYYASLSWWGGA